METCLARENVCEAYDRLRKSLDHIISISERCQNLRFSILFIVKSMHVFVE